MPNIKYTAAKGLVQASGSGSPNLFHVIAPSDTATTTFSGAGEIPVTHAYVAATAGGGVAWGLADGVAGQLLQIYSVDANDGTLTPDTKTGWSTIVFTNVGDKATLYYVNDTVGWIIISIDAGASGVIAVAAA